jgi:alpha-1,2-mannosyltransferase
MADQSIYDYRAGTFGFTYPPFAAIALYPMGLLPERVVHYLWIGITAVLIVALAKLVVSIRPSNLEKIPANLRLPVTASIFFLSVPFERNLHFGQIGVLLVFLLFLDISGRLPRKFRGFGTGLASAIKLIPLAFIPLLWFAGYRRAAYIGAGTAAGCTALAFIVLPSESIRYWFSEIFNTERIGDLGHPGNASIKGSLVRAGLDDAWPSTFLWLLICLAVTVLAYRRVQRYARVGDLYTAIVITGSMTLAVSPISWKHHQIWLLLALAISISAPRILQALWAILLLSFTMIPIHIWKGLFSYPMDEIIIGNIPMLLTVAIAVAMPFRYSEDLHFRRDINAPVGRNLRANVHGQPELSRSPRQRS